MTYFAHAGHSHEQASSILPTLLFFGIVLIGIAVLSYFLLKKPKTSDKKKIS